MIVNPRLAPWATFCRPSGAETLRDLPPLAVLAADELLRLGGVRHPQVGPVPLDRLAGAVGDGAEQHGFAQRAAVVELARRERRVGLEAGVDPLGVVADRLLDRRLGALEAGELLLRQ